LRKEHEFKLSAVREALKFAERKLGVSALLASRDLYACARPGEGQLGIRSVLQGLLARIQWDNKLAVRFFPP